MNSASRFLFLLTLLFAPLAAEEGMWPFNMVPKEAIQEKYGAQLCDTWIEEAQRSCLRISLGGSGSFVSSQGLVMTNHHVASKAIYTLSTGDRDLVAQGFYAKTLEDELICPNVFMDELQIIRDVTKEITSQNPKTEEALQSLITDIKNRAQKETGLQPQVVSLYQGARYHLYLYKRYTDVRLVMAPEKQIAYFGGDEANFEYPRYDLDLAFFRLYDQGKPLSTPSHFSWSKSGPKLNEVLFVAGNPGKTERLYTSDHLRFFQKVQIPLILSLLDERIEAVEAFSALSPENRRIGLQSLFSYANSQKVYASFKDAFKTGHLIQDKVAYERHLFQQLKEKTHQKLSRLQKPWRSLKNALKKATPRYPQYFILEGSASRYSTLYGFAKAIVRAHDEKQKPNNERLEEYTETELPSLEMSLFSTEPVYPAFDTVLLSDSLKRIETILGKNHPATKIALQGKTPEERANLLIQGTKLMDLAYRKELYENPQALDASTDTLILLAKALDPYAREMRTWEEEGLEKATKESYTKIAANLFTLYGEKLYPDATFTLRLSMGEMRGYGDIAPHTTVAGLFADAREHAGQEAYTLPASWTEKEGILDPKTPMNFVSTNDIIGGNSGSPIFNKEREIVGLIFDGNKESLPWNFAFNEERGRAVSVHSAAILEALKKVYGAERIAAELVGGGEAKPEKAQP